MLRRVFILHEWRGKGILNVVYEGAEEIAKSKGMSSLHARCSSIQTQHMCTKRGYEMVTELLMKDLEGV